jgi:hypothetical protein
VGYGFTNLETERSWTASLRKGSGRESFLVQSGPDSPKVTQWSSGIAVRAEHASDVKWRRTPSLFEPGCTIKKPVAEFRSMTKGLTDPKEAQLRPL